MKVFKSKQNNSIISNIVFDINSNDLLSKENKKRFNDLHKMFLKEFIEMQFHKGQELLDFVKEKDILNFDDYILFSHKEGTALIRIGYYNQDKPDISPAISFDIHSNVLGGTFSTGLYSDIHIIVNKDCPLLLYTKNTLPIHNLYLLWVFEKIEKTFLNKDFVVIEDIQLDSEYIIQKNKLFNSLIPEYEKYLY